MAVEQETLYFSWGVAYGNQIKWRQIPIDLDMRLLTDQDGQDGADRVYPMEQAADAHRRVATEQRLGAVVIAITG